MKPREMQVKTAARLRAADIPDPVLEAELLLRYFLGLDRVTLFLNDRELEPEELESFESLVVRRLAREPLSYIVGEREFWSLPFKVSPAVLIPRPETELLIAEVLKRVDDQAAFQGRILDLGTGSGVIPVVLARELPGARLTGVDISPEALVLAEENGRRHGVSERITWLRGRWLEPLNPSLPFEFIVANPPYVSEAERSSLQPELAHEPETALFAGPDGLAAIRTFLPLCPTFLIEGGWLLIEIGAEQDVAIREIFRTIPELTLQGITRDHAGLPRLVVARRD